MDPEKVRQGTGIEGGVDVETEEDRPVRTILSTGSFEKLFVNGHAFFPLRSLVPPLPLLRSLGLGLGCVRGSLAPLPSPVLTVSHPTRA